MFVFLRASNFSISTFKLILPKPLISIIYTNIQFSYSINVDFVEAAKQISVGSDADKAKRANDRSNFDDGKQMSRAIKAEKENAAKSNNKN